MEELDHQQLPAGLDLATVGTVLNLNLICSLEERPAPGHGHDHGREAQAG